MINQIIGLVLWVLIVFMAAVWYYATLNLVEFKENRGEWHCMTIYEKYQYIRDFWAYATVETLYGGGW